MNITDYIHFHVGAKILNPDGTVSTLAGVRTYDDINDDVETPVIFFKTGALVGKRKLEHCKLLLIPISKLPENEFRVLDYPGTFTIEEFKEYYNSGFPHLSASDVWYLIGKGYDVFGLIEAGHAIDITKTEYGKI